MSQQSVPDFTATASFDEQEKRLVSSLVSLSKARGPAESNALVQKYLSSSHHSESAKLEYAQTTTKHEASRQYLFKHGDEDVLKWLISTSKFTSPMVSFAASNTAFRSPDLWENLVEAYEFPVVRFFISEEDREERKNDVKDAINLFLDKAVDEIFSDEVISFWFSVETEEFDVSPVYRHARRLLQVDQELPESWVRKLWMTNKTNETSF